MKVIDWEEVSNTTKYSLDIEHEGKIYTWQVITGEDDSDTLFFNSDWEEIDIPDWTDDYDFWELYEQAKEQI